MKRCNAKPNLSWDVHFVGGSRTAPLGKLLRDFRPGSAAPDFAQLNREKYHDAPQLPGFLSAFICVNLRLKEMVPQRPGSSRRGSALASTGSTSTDTPTRCDPPPVITPVTGLTSV